MISSETLNVVENGSLQDLDVLLVDIVTAIAEREDCEEVIGMLSDNGIELTTDSTGALNICKRKRPN